jgi:glycosyltransferase involved in cell wall biosynthesis
MRFLMLNWRDPRNPRAGGAERVSRAYLAYLVQRGHEVYWFAPLFPGAASEEVIDGIHFARAGRIGSSIVKAMAWYRRQQHFDLVIDQHHGIPWYAPWWCRTHCVAYIHEVLGPIWNAFYRWPYNVIGRTQEPWTHWLYRKVPFWTPSTCTRDSLIAAGVKSVTVLPNGVDTQALPELDPKELSSPLRLVVVCRLAPNKRVDHAVQALKLLQSQGHQASLTVVGSGEVEHLVRRLVADLGLQKDVQFTGSLPEHEKNEALRRAHLLIHTSMREGWGLNVIEANAMGTPAVVYPVAGLIESTLNGVTGLVSSAETPDTLVDSLIGLMKAPDQYQRLRRQAWERAKTLHWDKVLPLAGNWLEQQASGLKSTP